MTTTEIELTGVGGPEVLVARERELQAPAEHEVRVRVEATGVSFAEQQMVRGKYYDQPPFPFVPGYDLVGTVEAVGAAVRDVSVGQRVAALTKTGGWTERVVVPAAGLAPVPDGVTAEQAETVVVNGVTALRMLHRTAQVREGDTIVVLGAAGGVASVLVQMAVHAGVRVLGTTGSRQLERVEALGATAIDYRAEDVPARVRELAPGGVAAVFDHVGGAGILESWRMLARGGTLVSYGTASTKDDAGDSRLPVLKLIARLAWWNVAPNGRRAHFFNLWAGKRRAERFAAQLREDLSAVLEMVRDGVIEPQVAARFALSDAAAALAFAERGGFTGKVVIAPAAT